MHLVMVRLKKSKTDDGFCEMHEHVKVGTEYLVDLDTLHDLNLWHIKTNTKHVKQVVQVNNGRWLPMELLEVVTEDLN